MATNGIDFPFDIGETSFPRQSTGLSAYIASLRSLINTSNLEVPMQPNVGTPMHRHVFENLTPIREHLIISDLRSLIKEFIPEITILNISVDSNESVVKLNILVELNGETEEVVHSVV